MIYNASYEICTYNVAKEALKPHDNLHFKQLIDQVIEFTNNQSNSLYLSQILKLLECINLSLENQLVTHPYQFKSFVAKVRDIAILLNVQQFRFRKECVHSTKDRNGEKFHLCCYFCQVLKSTFPPMFLFSTFEALKSIWTGQMQTNIDEKCNSHLLVITHDKNSLPKSNNDYIDYFLFFFKGYKFGNQDVYDVLVDSRKQHCKEWIKYYSTNLNTNEQNVNFVYSCVLPLLDNFGIVSFQEPNFSMLLRAIQCIFACAGTLSQFFAMTCKYQVLHISDNSKIKMKVKNKNVLRTLVPNVDENENISCVSKILIQDLSHMFGYDNIWNGSKLFGQFYSNLITEEKPNIALLDNETSSKVLFEIDVNSCIVPLWIQQGMSPAFSSTSVVVTSRDIESVIRYFVMSSLCEKVSSIDQLIMQYWTEIHKSQEMLMICSKNVSFDLLVEAGVNIIALFLQSTKCYLADLEPFSVNMNENNTPVIMIIFPYKHKLGRLINGKKCPLPLLLLLGTTISILCDSISPCHLKRFVRNIPSINPITQWHDRDFFLHLNQVDISGMGDLIIEGSNCLKEILSMPIHDEWTPIIIGLLFALSKLICGHKSLQIQIKSFLQYVLKVFNLDKLQTNTKCSSLPDHMLNKQCKSLIPGHQLLMTQYLFAINNKLHTFIPILRSAALFYGGIVLLDKVNMIVLPGYKVPKNIPSKDKKGGYNQLLECFDQPLEIVQKQWTEFLCRELFLKNSNVEIVNEWDFSFPFVFYIKEPEIYENVIIDKKINWMK